MSHLADPSTKGRRLISVPGFLLWADLYRIWLCKVEINISAVPQGVLQPSQALFDFEPWAEHEPALLRLSVRFKSVRGIISYRRAPACAARGACGGKELQEDDV